MKSGQTEKRIKQLTKLIPLFSKQKILVIGDIMVDKFVWGKVSRISPEAPVPVVEVSEETHKLGGAGNVSNNLTSLGSAVYLVGAIGDDIVGEQLKSDLRERNITIEGIVRDDNRPTSIKTRIIASHQQVVRVDKEVKGSFSPEIEKKIISNIVEIMPEVQGVIISDYGKGMISPAVLRTAIPLARKRGIPITVDPKIEHFLRYTRVSCITPNLSEAFAGMRILPSDNEESIVTLGNKILKKLRSESVLITRGEKGMTLFEPHQCITHIPTRAKEVFDVTGAGDTVIAAFTLSLAARANFRDAAEISNFAAGIVVGKLGTATVTPGELKTTMESFQKSAS